MYTDLSALPVPTGAHFTLPSSLQITFSVRDHVRNVKRTVSKNIALPDLVATGLSDVGDDIVVSLYSRFKRLRAVLRDTKSSRFVEIWEKEQLVACKDVTPLHGQFYSDEFISSTTFCPSGTKLLYIAEQNPPTAPPDDPFTKFRYSPSFGEGLANFKRPAVFILSWSTHEEPLLYQLAIPTPGRLPIHFGQTVFHSHNVLYATGYELMSDSRLLGIKYCTNRPFGIWRIDLTYPSTPNGTGGCVTIDCAANKITPAELSCRSPRIFDFAEGRMLGYLSCKANGPHSATNSLHLLPIDSPTSSPKNLVPIVDEPPPGCFPGLYPPYTLAASCLIQHEAWDAPKIVTSSTWGSRNTIVCIDTQTGDVVNITPDGSDSWSLLTTDGRDRIVCAASSLAVPHQVLLGTVSAKLSVDWTVVHQPELRQDIEKSLSTLEMEILPVPNRHPVETIVLRETKSPKSQIDSPPPCVLIPHGGPHASSTTEFNPTTAALALNGYTLALPNYTGSLGFGQSSVLRLLGNCGTLDVQDCMQALRHLADIGYAQFDKGKLFIYGGSHGGFLGAHLIGQFPDVFTAVVLRNPVISAGEMLSATDIPDWCYAEFGLPYPTFPSQADSTDDALIKKISVAPDVYEKLYNYSPIHFADKVKADVLLLIGKDDLRVPPTQGYGYYHTLKAFQSKRADDEGQRIEMLVFPGESHPLEGIECARVGWEAVKAWFSRRNLE